jgi:hypothetical protein
MILLSSASWVARITGVSHQPPTQPSFFFFFFFGTTVWTQGFMLARQAFYHLSHSTSPVSTFKNSFFLVLVLGFEFRASCLLGKCSNTWTSS